jgi:hypothetical protein
VAFLLRTSPSRKATDSAKRYLSLSVEPEQDEVGVTGNDLVALAVSSALTRSRSDASSATLPSFSSAYRSADRLGDVVDERGLYREWGLISIVRDRCRSLRLGLFLLLASDARAAMPCRRQR